MMPDPLMLPYADQITKRTGFQSRFRLPRIGQTGHAGGWGYGIAQWTTVDWANPFNDRKAKLWILQRKRV